MICEHNPHNTKVESGPDRTKIMSLLYGETWRRKTSCSGFSHDMATSTEYAKGKHRAVEGRRTCGFVLPWSGSPAEPRRCTNPFSHREAPHRHLAPLLVFGGAVGRTYPRRHVGGRGGFHRSSRCENLARPRATTMPTSPAASRIDDAAVDSLDAHWTGGRGGFGNFAPP